MSKLNDIMEDLAEFAKYHHLKGGQAAHRLIKEKFLSEAHLIPIDNSEESILKRDTYVQTVKTILLFLHKEFVP